MYDPEYVFYDIRVSGYFLISFLETVPFCCVCVCVCVCVHVCLSVCVFECVSVSFSFHSTATVMFERTFNSVICEADTMHRFLTIARKFQGSTPALVV